MSKKQSPTREPWDATALQAVAPPTPEAQPADGEAWTAYRVLVAQEALSDGELTELGRLAQAIGRSPAEVELDHTILAEAARLQSLIAQADEIQAADEAAAKANAIARDLREKEIRELACKLRDNDYPESRAYNATRQQMTELQAATGELSTIRARWPTTFGLPPCRRHTSESMPCAVTAKMTQLGILISGS